HTHSTSLQSTNMQYTSAAGSPPDPRLPKSITVAICKILFVSLVFYTLPTAHASTVRPDATPHADMSLAPIESAVATDVLTPFVPPDMPSSSAPRGISIATSSTEGLAPSSGQVTFVGVVVDRPVISIRHRAGLVSSLEPVTSDLAFGDPVSQG